MRKRQSERGAAAVEFALVFPLVIMLLITVLEFSRLWNIQATIADGARIAARYAAIHHEDADVIAQATSQATAIPGFVDWSAATIDIDIDCEGAETASSAIEVSPGSITAWFADALGTPITLSATGRMPCGG
ncbi:TadE/TadG family type IV pilus assembly protein [Agromyces sp. SYSU T00266]|uniref:TadE/TadG family type IV pilus assembly protein n=1 Tax=Agromyces zhanjiangensis TaxID=3158562 RepID=UPI00339834EF